MSTITVAELGNDAELAGLRETVASLTTGTLLLLAAGWSFLWVAGAVRFVSTGGAWTLFGVLAVTTLGVLLVAYAWALLVRGLTAVIGMGVADALARRE